jgi:diacylglycerol kinase family enzyme
MMASAGLDAQALKNLPLERKRRYGRAAILWQGLEEWTRFPGPTFAVEAAGSIHRARFAALCNIPFYGGRIPMAPAARIDDRLLDLVLFRGSSRRALLSFLLDLARGNHLQRPDVTHLQGQEFSLSGPATVSLQLDGDPGPELLPVGVRLAEHRLRVLVPRHSAAPLSSQQNLR